MQNLQIALVPPPSTAPALPSGQGIAAGADSIAAGFDAFCLRLGLPKQLVAVQPAGAVAGAAPVAAGDGPDRPAGGRVLAGRGRADDPAMPADPTALAAGLVPSVPFAPPPAERSGTPDVALPGAKAPKAVPSAVSPLPPAEAPAKGQGIGPALPDRGAPTAAAAAPANPPRPGLQVPPSGAADQVSAHGMSGAASPAQAVPVLPAPPHGPATPADGLGERPPAPPAAGLSGAADSPTAGVALPNPGAVADVLDPATVAVAPPAPVSPVRPDDGASQGMPDGPPSAAGLKPVAAPAPAREGRSESGAEWRIRSTAPTGFVAGAVIAPTDEAATSEPMAPVTTPAPTPGIGPAAVPASPSGVATAIAPVIASGALPGAPAADAAVIAGSRATEDRAAAAMPLTAAPGPTTSPAPPVASPPAEGAKTPAGGAVPAPDNARQTPPAPRKPAVSRQAEAPAPDAGFSLHRGEAIGPGPALPRLATASGGALRTLPDPAPVLAQVTQATAEAAPGVTDLRLSPEELGSVRIELRTEGDRVTVAISAERQDTLDLMRRHADRLAGDLRAAGFAQLDLSFGRWSGQGQNPDQGGPQAGARPADLPAPRPEAAPPLSPLPRPTPTGAGGLYLRF